MNKYKVEDIKAMPAAPTATQKLQPYDGSNEFCSRRTLALWSLLAMAPNRITDIANKRTAKEK